MSQMYETIDERREPASGDSPTPAECSKTPDAPTESLERLAVGRSARVVLIASTDPTRLVRLSNLGIVPGVTVRVRLRQPATVIVLGETTLALDRTLASEIYVKPLAQDA